MDNSGKNKREDKKGSDPNSGSDPEKQADVHVVHLWCWLGTARSQNEVAELLEQVRRPQFDLDHYRILERHLANGKARVVELGVVPCT